MRDSSPKPKEKLSFVDKRSESNEASSRVVRGSEQVSMYEMRKGSKYMKMPGRCTRPFFLSKGLGKWRSRHLGGCDLVRRMDR